MKAVFRREALCDAVQAVAGALNVRAPRPALQCIHFHAKGEAVTVSATDLRLAIRRRITAESVQEEGQAAVQGARLGALLREVTDEKVALSIDAASATLKAGRSSFRLMAEDPAGFAELPKFGKKQLVVDAELFDALVRRTIFAAAQEQGRYAIDGVSLLARDGEVQLAATDGRRLAVAIAKVEGASMDQCVVPPKMLAEIRRHAAGAGAVDLERRGGRLLARVGQTVVAGSLLEGAFPAYQDMIPAPTDRRLRVSASELASKLRQAVQLTTEDSRAVVLCLSAGTLRMEAKSAAVGEAVIEMDVEYTGEEMKVAYNAQFLLDALPEFGDAVVDVEIAGPEAPAVIRLKDHVYVLAVVRVDEGRR